MGNCKLIDELNRLKKSSSDSIDGIGSFDDFKKYMHVSRSVEEDLIEILHKIEVSGKKSLVLLCGSAGDGKSHLLSYLKNDLRLLDNYVVYNDATESSAPSKTAIETLNEALQEFSDEKLEQPGKNFILAINLGVLSNFVESLYGDSFKQLREYVINSNILTNQLNEKGYEKNSAFQHVSFSDYHMYNLTVNGVKPEYLEHVLEKIFRVDFENPFYNVLYATEEELSDFGSGIYIEINFSGIVLPLILFPDEVKSVEMVGRKILREKFSAKKSFEIEEDGDHFYQGSQEYHAKTNLLRELRSEKRIINERILHGKCKQPHGSDDLEIEAEELILPLTLKQAYYDLLQAYKDNNTIPTLAYMSEELKTATEEFLREFNELYEDLEEGSYLSQETKRKV